MSIQRQPFLLGLSAIALLVVGVIALSGSALSGSALPLSAIATVLMLLNIGLAFAALHTAEGGRRTLQIVGLAASILFTLGVIAIQLNLLGQKSSITVPYLVPAYLFLSTLVFIIDGIWGKDDWSAWRRYIIPSIGGVVLLIGVIFAWVTLAR